MNTITASIAAALLVSAGAATAASRFDGTWKYDIASQEVSKKPNVYLLQNGSYTCSTCAPVYTVKADGAFHKVGGNPYRDEMSIKVADARTVVMTTRLGGKPMLVATSTVAADGKTAANVFNDTSASNGVAVSGTATTRRVAAGPAGSHAVSGSWLDTTTGTVSDAGLLVTMASTGNTMKVTSPTGSAYTAKTDGTMAPVTGDRGWTSVSLKQSSPATMVETDYRDGKVIGVSTYTMAADGKTIHAALNDKLHGMTSAATLIKQ